MTSHLPDPEKTIDTFAAELSLTVYPSGWTVARTVNDASDRAFHLVKGPDRIDFLVKLSQTERGFWGLQEKRAAEMLAKGWHLVLLTGATRGYVIRAPRLQALLSRASRSTTGFKINEHILKAVRYSPSIAAIWNSLQ